MTTLHSRLPRRDDREDRDLHCVGPRPLQALVARHVAPRRSASIQLFGSADLPFLTFDLFDEVRNGTIKIPGVDRREKAPEKANADTLPVKNKPDF